MNEDKKGNLFVFLFPFEIFASHYAQNEVENSICKAIEVDKFIDEVIEKLLSHNVLDALVFPVANGYGLNVSLSQLKKDLEEELGNY